MRETDEIAWLRGVLEQATPGPWRVDPEYPSTEVVAEDSTCIVEMHSEYWHSNEQCQRDGLNAQAIAALGTLWPELLAAVEVLVSRECAGCNLGYALREVYREDGSACVEHHGGPRGRRWVMACSVPLAEHRVRVALRDAIRAHRERVDAGE